MKTSLPLMESGLIPELSKVTYAFVQPHIRQYNLKDLKTY